jgi:hypothetical protein
MTLEESIKQYKKDLASEGFDASLPTEEPTYMDEIVGALDHGADVVSGMVGGFLNTGQTLVDLATGVPEDEMIRAAEYREKEFDYIPRTDIGQEYSDTGKKLLGKGMSAVSQAWKNNRGMLGETVNSAIDYTEDEWNALSEKARMGISAGTELGAVAFGGAAASAAKKTASGVKTALNKGKEANRFVLPSDLADPLDNSDVPQLEPAPVAQIESTPIIKPELDTLAPVVDEIGYTSGIEEGIIAMINDPKVPKNVNAAQLMALLKKRGAKDDEIEWSTFSDYVDTLGKKQLPLEEALRQARDRAITLEVIEARPSKGGATPPMFSENDAKWESLTPEGGTNYREYKFRFDNTNPNRMAEINETKALEQKLRGEIEELRSLLDTEKINEAYNDLLKNDEQYLRMQTLSAEFNTVTIKQDLQKRKYELKRVATKGTPDGRVYYNKIRELNPVLKQVQMDTRELRGTQFLNEAHWGKQPNYLFFTRITDRNIDGGNSFGIDEMQSDWHQGKGAVEDRPYYKLPESKLKDYIQSQYDIAEKRRNSLYNEIHLLEGGDGDLRNSYNKSVNKLNPDNPNEYSVGYILKEQRKLWEEYRMQGLEIPDNLKEWSNDLDSQLFQIESRHPLIRDKLDKVNDEYDTHDRGLRELEIAETTALVRQASLYLGKEAAEKLAKEGATEVLEALEAAAMKATNKGIKDMRAANRKEGYEEFTKRLRPNAPLKNKEKWMTAALNAMLYRAVKDGYDSVSWPNGQTNYVKYGGTSLPAGAKEQLLKMYDVTLPKLISKVAKKMDKDAEIVFGKKSEDSTPRPDDDISDIDVEAAPWDAPSVNRDLLIEDFEKYEDALISQNERPENILGITEFYIREIESFPDRYSLTPRQRFGSYTNDMDYMDTPPEGRLNYEQFLEEINRRQRDNDGGIPKKVFDKPNSAYSHIKITPAMKEAILKGKALFNKGGLVEDEMAELFK